MDLRSVDLNLLVAFDALYCERSVTGAAARLGLRQPAMSEALARLRRLFDDPLFVRASGAMQPTPKAEAMRPALSEGLDLLRSALGQAIAFAPDSSRRTFTIGSTDYTSAVLLPPLVAILRREAEGVDLRVVGYDKDMVGPMLDRGEMDLALGVFPDPPQGAVKVALFVERFVGVARRDHPALRDGPPGLAAFMALPQALVSVRRDVSGAVDKALKQAGHNRRAVVVTPHMGALPQILVASDLIAALPARAAEVLDEQLQRFDLPLDIPSWSVEMLWSPAARRDQANQWLREKVKAVALQITHA